MTGLLINDRSVEVPGVHILNVHDDARLRLDGADCRARKTTWVRQVILHSTGGRWPQPIVEADGPGGEALRYADIWHTDPTHSGAHVLVESNGSAACLADLATACAYHAEASNDWSVGIEMYQRPDGGIHMATIRSTVAIVRTICEAMNIPLQLHAKVYANAPLLRMEASDGPHRHQIGGPDCVGVFGHRDNTSNRGQGDPGDAIYSALFAAGAEPLDYSTGVDLRIGAARQRWLNAEANRRGETLRPLTVDGLVGPRSLERARQLVVPRWRDVPVA